MPHPGRHQRHPLEWQAPESWANVAPSPHTADRATWQSCPCEHHTPHIPSDSHNYGEPPNGSSTATPPQQAPLQQAGRVPPLAPVGAAGCQQGWVCSAQPSTRREGAAASTANAPHLAAERLQHRPPAQGISPWTRQLCVQTGREGRTCGIPTLRVLSLARAGHSPVEDLRQVPCMVSGSTVAISPCYRLCAHI